MRSDKNQENRSNLFTTHVDEPLHIYKFIKRRITSLGCSYDCGTTITLSVVHVCTPIAHNLWCLLS